MRWWQPGCAGLLLGVLVGCPIQATLDMPCETSGDCPHNWVCVDNSCQRVVVIADAGVADGTPGDGGRRDTGGATDRALTTDSALRDRRLADTSLPRDAARRDSTVRVDSGRNDTAVRRDSAAPRDAGAGDTSCGSITFVGLCQGNVLKWCEGNALGTYDCAAGYGSGATCGLYDCTQEADGCYGYGCVARAGQACNVDPDNLGCDLDLGHGCRGDVCTVTSVCNPASDAPSCTGNRVNFCPYGRAWDYDCSQGGAAPYVCQDTGNGYSDCLGTAGGDCDLTSNPPWNCATGYSCNSGTCG